MDSETFDTLISSAFDRRLPVPHDQFNEFLILANTNELGNRIGDAHIVDSYHASTENHWCDLPDALIPFMWVRQPNHFDYYCFDLKHEMNDDCPVEVFAVHTTVHGWPCFEAFLQWLKMQ